MRGRIARKGRKKKQNRNGIQRKTEQQKNNKDKMNTHTHTQSQRNKHNITHTQMIHYDSMNLNYEGLRFSAKLL